MKNLDEIILNSKRKIMETFFKIVKNGHIIITIHITEKIRNFLSFNFVLISLIIIHMHPL